MHEEDKYMGGLGHSVKWGVFFGSTGRDIIRRVILIVVYINHGFLAIYPYDVMKLCYITHWQR